MSSNSTTMIPDLRTEFERVMTRISSAEAQTATLDQMERHVLKEMLRLGQRLLQTFVDQRCAAETHVAREQGDQTWPYHSQKAVDYRSVFGPLVVRRAYFYASGQGGRTPLDAALSLPEHCYSDLLMESASLLAVDGAYHKAAQVLERLLGVNLSTAGIETEAADQAQAVLDFYAAQPPPPAPAEGVILVAQADGKGVPLVRPSDDQPHRRVRRGKGDKKTRKKEAIVTAVYTLAAQPRTPGQLAAALFAHGAAVDPHPEPRHKRLFARLDGKDAALQRLAGWVHQRDGRHIRHRVALTDGASALQHRIGQRLRGFTLVLDIIHVVEYLWKAANALYGETNPYRARWVEAQVRDLLASRTRRVIDRLRAKANGLAKSSLAARALRQAAQYFERNQPHMQYATYLRRGWPVATGVIEGACRHLVKDRMELSGMRWTVSGANAILALRAVNENGDWEAFHAFRREQRHRRLYTTPLPTTWLAHAERLEIN